MATLLLIFVVLQNTWLTGPDTGVHAVRASSAISVDGFLDEPDWVTAPVIDGFLQRDPVEGAKPSQRTEVRLLYDDAALYVGARMFDSAPDSIIARLGRRDANLESDLFGILIDPYLDRQSGFYFGVNAAGTLYDGVLYNDDWDSNSWDGVWEARVRIDEKGWVAEMRIPYSQLRFTDREEHVWGVNFRRDISRNNERIFLVYTPRNESGFVSRFLPLSGIRDIHPPRRIEILPYATTKASYTDFTPGDPFNDGSRYAPAAGGDIKLGIGSNLTLDGTFNPDFGQVEVDPAVVNLSDFETFFPERRPFFLEGASTFRFGQGGARSFWGFNWPSPSFFYSRRIGRAPQGRLPAHDYASMPEGARILGAGKVTGKLLDNWNVGMLHAVTSREHARLELDGDRFRAEIEPLTYYGVTRSQREFEGGLRAIGFITSVTSRHPAGEFLQHQLNTGAYAGGIDGWTFLDKDRTWVVTGWLGMSHVAGTHERMTQLQRNPTHYFQRPDAGHVRVDSTATSLTGLAGRFHLNKQRGRYFVNSAFGFIDPGFDTDDVGFIFRSDVINWHVGGGRMWSEITRWTRFAETGLAVFQNFDYGGNQTWSGVFNFGFVRFLNYYSVNWNLAYNPETVNNRRTRGGPLTTNPPGYQIDVNARTDNRKPLVAGVGFGTYQSAWNREVNFRSDFEWKAASNISVTIGPAVGYERAAAQWIGAFDDPHAVETFGRRYVFAEMDRVTVSSNIRLNWTFTPVLSFQMFAQPLVSAATFDNFKALARPRTFEFDVFGENGSTFDRDTFTADPDGPGPAAPITFNDPDFNFVSLRGNAVLRWEYRPGSTLFLVWTQRRSDWMNDGDFNLGPSFNRLLTSRPDNIFMVKVNYWLNL